jgi:hypothetical protein
MAANTRFLTIALLGSVAACAAPEYRWLKANTDTEVYRADLAACHETVDRDFNPYYDYGIPGNSRSQEALFRQDAAEQMFRDCMRGRGYRLVRVDPPAPR